MDGFPSGQREQTVNLPAPLSVVRIHPRPPKKAISYRMSPFVLLEDVVKITAVFAVVRASLAVLIFGVRPCLFRNVTLCRNPASGGSAIYTSSHHKNLIRKYRDKVFCFLHYRSPIRQQFNKAVFIKKLIMIFCKNKYPRVETRGISFSGITLIFTGCAQVRRRIGLPAMHSSLASRQRVMRVKHAQLLALSVLL